MIKLNRHLKDRAVSALRKENEIRKILISEDAAAKLPSFIKENGYARILIAGITDNEEKTNSLCETLGKEDIECSVHLLETGFTPDKDKVGELIISTPSDCDLIIAAGNRQIADLCKYVSSRIGVDLLLYPTSPCIEGYILDEAVLVENGEETLYEADGPVALFANTGILNKRCPVALSQIYGIFVNVFEWKTKGLIDEDGAKKLLTAAEEALASRDVRKVMNAIIMRDLAIKRDSEGRLDYPVNYDLSSFFEAKTYREGKKPLLKERSAALSLIACLKMYEELAKDAPEATILPSVEEVEKEVLAYGAAINPRQLNLSKTTLAQGLAEAFEGNPLVGEKDCTEKAVAYFDEQRTYEEYRKKRNQELIGKVKMFVLDMDGTIYLSNDLFPFTKDFLDKVRESGREAYYFTNNSSKNQGDYIGKLARLGIPTDEKHMMLSTQVIIRYLKENNPDDSCYIVGTESLVKAFRDAGFVIDDQDPDMVILGFDTSLNYEKLEKACTFLRHGAKYFGVNMDYNCPVAGGEYIPDCGSIAKLVERSTGRFPEFFGKPSHHTLDYIIKGTGYKEDEICVIGDRIYTDIKVADGRDTLSIMVLTGETQLEDLENYDYAPDIIMESLAEVAEYL